MKTKQPKTPGDQVFSHPIRKLKADEIEKVAGGEFYEQQFHGKCNGGMDNQGRDFG